MFPRPFRRDENQTYDEILRTQYTEQIAKATGATGEVAWILEGIARDEILDGNFSGASRERLDVAFREAHAIFRSDEATYRELYGIHG